MTAAWNVGRRGYGTKGKAGAATAGTGPTRSKYGNRRTVVDGITFQSAKEARRYSELRLREKAGEIRDLVRQFLYPVKINGVKVCSYTADFVYRERREIGQDSEWLTVVEDAKGYKTSVYRLKKKLMLALLGIEIRES